MHSKTVFPMAIGRAGDEVRIHAVRADQGQTQRLRELGVLEGRTLRIITNSDPLICEVGNCRFGVCRRLARCILVESAKSPLARSA
ncbi:MAG: hypothetical protein AMXMBFR13_03910 [Phycisphaerae bacterium]